MGHRTSAAEVAERSKGTMFPPEYLNAVACEMGIYLNVKLGDARLYPAAS